MDRQDIESLVRTKSRRITLCSDGDASGSGGQKRSGGTYAVLSSFKRIKLDSKELEYVACSQCSQVFKYIPKNGTSTLS